MGAVVKMLKELVKIQKTKNEPEDHDEKAPQRLALTDWLKECLVEQENHLKLMKGELQ